MIFNTNRAQQIIDKFNVGRTALSTQAISEDFTENKTRAVYKIETEDGLLICRISNEPNYPKELIDKQSDFANVLYAGGIHTSFKISVNGNYCISEKLDGIEYNVTLETFAGQSIEDVRDDIFYEFGSLIGCIHSISESKNIHIKKSNVYLAVKNGNADFKKLLEKRGYTDFEDVNMQKLTVLHNSLVQEIKSKIDDLPCSAVQGDVGIFNNIVISSGKMGIIDYNLAGDTPYIIDMLSAYYSSVHKKSWQEKLKNIDKNKALDDFLKGYTEKRKLQEIEINIYPAVSALFDGLFFCKAFMDEGNFDDLFLSQINVKKAEQLFSPSNHAFKKE